jgi:hypothetical protein
VTQASPIYRNALAEQLLLLRHVSKSLRMTMQAIWSSLHGAKPQHQAKIFFSYRFAKQSMSRRRNAN